MLRLLGNFADEHFLDWGICCIDFAAGYFKDVWVSGGALEEEAAGGWGVVPHYCGADCYFFDEQGIFWAGHVGWMMKNRNDTRFSPGYY